jgi:hypothetical protein
VLQPLANLKATDTHLSNIQVNVVLKVGYQWLSSDAEDTGDGQEMGSLPLEWLLDFEGGGSQKRCRLKVKREKEGVDEEITAQREEVTRLWMRQRQTDPDYDDVAGEG